MYQEQKEARHRLLEISTVLDIQYYMIYYLGVGIKTLDSLTQQY